MSVNVIVANWELQTIIATVKNYEAQIVNQKQECAIHEFNIKKEMRKGSYGETL